MVGLVLVFAGLVAVCYFLALALGLDRRLLVAVVALALLVPEHILLAGPVLDNEVLALLEAYILDLDLHVLESPAHALDLPGVGPSYGLHLVRDVIVESVG